MSVSSFWEVLEPDSRRVSQIITTLTYSTRPLWLENLGHNGKPCVAPLYDSPLYQLIYQSAWLNARITADLRQMRTAGESRGAALDPPRPDRSRFFRGRRAISVCRRAAWNRALAPGTSHSSTCQRSSTTIFITAARHFRHECAGFNYGTGGSPGTCPHESIRWWRWSGLIAQTSAAALRLYIVHTRRGGGWQSVTCPWTRHWFCWHASDFRGLMKKFHAHSLLFVWFSWTWMSNVMPPQPPHPINMRPKHALRVVYCQFCV